MRKTELNYFDGDNCLAGYDYYPFYEIFKSINFLIAIKVKEEKVKGKGKVKDKNN